MTTRVEGEFCGRDEWEQGMEGSKQTELMMEEWQDHHHIWKPGAASKQLGSKGNQFPRVKPISFSC